jgi:hypothetical protein
MNTATIIFGIIAAVVILGLMVNETIAEMQGR